MSVYIYIYSLNVRIIYYLCSFAGCGNRVWLQSCLICRFAVVVVVVRGTSVDADALHR